MQIRFIAFTLSLVAVLIAGAQDNPLLFKDPRHYLPGLTLSFDKGRAPKDNTVLARSILVINWSPPPDRDNRQLSEPKFEGWENWGKGVWQIGGLRGYFTQREVEAILAQVYSLCSGVYSGNKKHLMPNLIVAGNHIGSGRQIEPLIKVLSAEHQFHSYHIAGIFIKATLSNEPEHRVKLLKEAQSRVQQGEQDSADQPATAVESKVEGEEKPKTESDGRSQ